MLGTKSVELMQNQGWNEVTSPSQEVQSMPHVTIEMDADEHSDESRLNNLNSLCATDVLRIIDTLQISPKSISLARKALDNIPPGKSFLDVLHDPVHIDDLVVLHKCNVLNLNRLMVSNDNHFYNAIEIYCITAQDNLSTNDHKKIIDSLVSLGVSIYGAEKPSTHQTTCQLPIEIAASQDNFSLMAAMLDHWKPVLDFNYSERILKAAMHANGQCKDLAIGMYTDAVNIELEKIVGLKNNSTNRIQSIFFNKSPINHLSNLVNKIVAHSEDICLHVLGELCLHNNLAIELKAAIFKNIGNMNVAQLSTAFKMLCNTEAISFTSSQAFVSQVAEQVIRKHPNKEYLISLLKNMNAGYSHIDDYVYTFSRKKLLEKKDLLISEIDALLSIRSDIQAKLTDIRALTDQIIHHLDLDASISSHRNNPVLAERLYQMQSRLRELIHNLPETFNHFKSQRLRSLASHRDFLAAINNHNLDDQIRVKQAEIDQLALEVLPPEVLKERASRASRVLHHYLVLKSSVLGKENLVHDLLPANNASFARRFPLNHQEGIFNALIRNAYALPARGAMNVINTVILYIQKSHEHDNVELQIQMQLFKDACSAFVPRSWSDVFYGSFITKSVAGLSTLAGGVMTSCAETFVKKNAIDKQLQLLSDYHDRLHNLAKNCYKALPDAMRIFGYIDKGIIKSKNTRSLKDWEYDHAYFPRVFWDENAGLRPQCELNVFFLNPAFRSIQKNLTYVQDESTFIENFASGIIRRATEQHESTLTGRFNQTYLDAMLDQKGITARGTPFAMQSIIGLYDLISYGDNHEKNEDILDNVKYFIYNDHFYSPDVVAGLSLQLDDSSYRRRGPADYFQAISSNKLLNEEMQDRYNRLHPIGPALMATGVGIGLITAAYCNMAMARQRNYCEAILNRVDELSVPPSTTD